VDLRYEPERGFVVIGLERGGELMVSAQRCQIIPMADYGNDSM
jgi:hypothetical protein